jgi:hypothetical protein
MESDFTTGANIHIDGGNVATGKAREQLGWEGTFRATY